MPNEFEDAEDTSPAESPSLSKAAVLRGRLRALWSRLLGNRLQALWSRPLATRLRGLFSWPFKTRLRAAIATAACLVLIGGGATGWLLLKRAKPAPEAPVTLETVLAALDDGSNALAADLAKRLQETGENTNVERGGTTYVFGVFAAAKAEKLVGRARIEQYLCASRYLEESRELGFPAGRDADGFYWLARSLYLSGRVAAARDALQRALPLNEPRAAELHRMLADAYLCGATIEPEKALAHCDAYLADESLSVASRNDVLVKRARILLQLDRLAECRQTLDRLPAAAQKGALPQLMEGRLAMGQAGRERAAAIAAGKDTEAGDKKYVEAIAILRKAEAGDRHDPAVAGPAMYLIGVCYLESGDSRAALKQFQRTRRIHTSGAEYVAANLQEADLLVKAGECDEAITAYRRALEHASRPEDYDNPWISFGEVRTRLTALQQGLLGRKDFAASLRLAGLLSVAIGRNKTMEITAETYEAWNRDLLAAAENMPHVKAEAVQAEVRAHFRDAGRIHAQLAETLVMTRRYPDELWNSASCYFQGRDYRAALAVLDKYLKNESQKRRPQALVLRGETLLALDRVDDAAADFRECIEFHARDVASFRARLLAAQAYLEKGDAQRAETLLLENLSGEHLAPASREWRDSLFMLGELLHGEKRDAEAVIRLDEAVRRYPAAPQALEARYFLAHGHHRIAAAAKSELATELSADQRAACERRFAENSAKAADYYREVREGGLRRDAREGLRPHEAALTRNAAFALGELLCDQGDFTGALRAYYAVANQCFERPEALSAYVQIARLYQRLGQMTESRTTIEQAKAMLAGLKADADTRETTDFTRLQWGELLDSFGKLSSTYEPEQRVP